MSVLSNKTKDKFSQIQKLLSEIEEDCREQEAEQITFDWAEKARYSVAMFRSSTF